MKKMIQSNTDSTHKPRISYSLIWRVFFYLKKCVNYFHVEDAGAAVVQIDWRNMYLEEIKLPHRIKTFGGGAHREVFFYRQRTFGSTKNKLNNRSQRAKSMWAKFGLVWIISNYYVVSNSLIWRVFFFFLFFSSVFIWRWEVMLKFPA